MSEFISETLTIETELDLIKARRLMRNLSKKMGFNVVNQTKIITAVSELTRNVLHYARRGKLTVDNISYQNKMGLRISIKDNGPGIADIEKVLKGGYSTSGGLGKGLSGTRQLMDEFEIISDLGKGTEVNIIKWT